MVSRVSRELIKRIRDGEIRATDEYGRLFRRRNLKEDLKKKSFKRYKEDFKEENEICDKKCTLMNKQFYNKQLNKRRKEEKKKRRKEEDFDIDCWRITKRFSICSKRRNKRKRSN